MPSTSLLKICFAVIVGCSNSCGSQTSCPLFRSNLVNSLLKLRSAALNRGPARYIFILLAPVDRYRCGTYCRDRRVIGIEQRSHSDDAATLIGLLSNAA